MRHEKGIVLRLVIALLLFTLSSGFSLAATQLDTSFGEDGFVVKDFGLGDDVVYGLAVQEDGKIIAAGYSNNGAVKNLAVARYLPNGDLDTDFNNIGILTLSLGSGDTLARSLVVQEDGKIVLAGSTNDGESNIVVIRLTMEGNQDRSFGVDGQLMIPLGEGEAKTVEVQIAPDGTVVVAGSIGVDGSTAHSFVAKLNTRGELDETFGSDGITFIKQAYGINITTFVLLEGGKIQAGGSVVYDGVPEASLFRLNEDGSMDESYGINGESKLSIEGAGSGVNDISIGMGGAILASGFVDNGNYLETFVAMVDEKGDFVSEFGESGLYQSTLLYENVANAMALQNDGSILVAGYADAGQGDDVFLMVVEGKGSLSNLQKTIPLSEPDLIVAEGSEGSDTSDNEQPADDSVGLLSSYTATDVASNDDTGNALAILPDGKILTAGSSENGNDRDFTVLRYENVDTVSFTSEGISARGVVTSGFRAVTMYVIDVTRVGAVAVSAISETSTLSCKTGCTQECENEEDPDANFTCTKACENEGDQDEIDTCTQECVNKANRAAVDACFEPCLIACEAKPTVALRGVTYSVTPSPVYREDSAEDPVAVPLADEDGNTPVGDTFTYDVVRSGQTEDGSGIGDYGSDIQEITPDTTYYLRAYAVLSDDTVIYGNQLIFKTRDSCFIATAAYGSLLDKHVMILREFRDKVMMGDRLGEKLIGMYYHFSPKIAGIIEQNELLRAIVRILLLPVVLMAFVVVKTTLVTKLCLLAVIVGLGLVASIFLRKVKVTPL